MKKLKKYKICTKKGNDADCYWTNNIFKYWWVKLKIFVGIVNKWE